MADGKTIICKPVKNTVILVMILLLASCGRYNHTNMLLDKAGAIIVEHPDSSKTILASLDKGDLRTRGQKARHALLYSIALDKTWEDVTTDTIIAPAVDYYLVYGDAKKRMLVHYYLGRIQENANTPSHAIVSYTKAEKYAKKLNDNLYLGLIYRSLSGLNNITYNAEEELRYAKEAFKHFKLLNNDIYCNYALLDIATSYNNLHKFDKSLEYCRRAIKVANQKQDTVLWTESLKLYAKAQLMENKTAPEQVIAIYDKMSDLGYNFNVTDFCNLANCHVLRGDIETANKIVTTLIRQQQKDFKAKVNLLNSKYLLNKQQGRYKDALSDFEEVSKLQDSIFRIAVHQSAVVSQRDYFYQESEYNKLKAKHNLAIIGLLATLLSFVTVTIVIKLKRISKQKEEKEFEYRYKIDMVMLRLNEQNNDINELSRHIQNLFKSKFEFVEKICCKYYEYNNVSVRKEHIYQEVCMAIDDLSKDSDMAVKLESLLNNHRNGIMHKFRNDFPNLKERDFQLMSYWYAGFSSMTMSLLQGDEIKNIYVRKSRIKAKIKASSSQHKDIFLDNLR